MVAIHPITLALAIGAIAVAISTVPFTVAAIGYRQRDNGLAYILLVTGVGVWNAMFAAQLLSEDPLIQAFFLGLSVVGAVQASLGFLLFATTASSTPPLLSRWEVYATVGILGGLDIIFAVTAPVHRFYWALHPDTTGTISFAAIEPSLGYWLHTLLLLALIGTGVGLFYVASRDRPTDPYLKAYVAAGTITMVAILASNAISPGGFGVGSIAAVSLTSVGWLQASRGRPLAWIRGGVA